MYYRLDRFRLFFVNIKLATGDLVSQQIKTTSGAEITTVISANRSIAIFNSTKVSTIARTTFSGAKTTSVYDNDTEMYVVVGLGSFISFASILATFLGGFVHWKRKQRRVDPGLELK